MMERRHLGPTEVRLFLHQYNLSTTNIKQLYNEFFVIFIINYCITKINVLVGSNHMLVMVKLYLA